MSEALFHALFSLCHALSWPLALLHAIVAEGGIVHLRRRWFTKGVRELQPLILRSPLRSVAMDRVRFDLAVAPGTGCVVATIHSTWTKWLSHWCRERRVGLVLVTDGRSRWLGDAAIGSDPASLRRIVDHLRAGGILFTAVDIFTLVPARLARIAQVPIVAGTAHLRDGVLEASFGPALRVHDRGNERAVMQAVVAHIESRIRGEPEIWNETVRRWAGLKARREEAAVDADRLAGHEGGRG